MKRSINKLVLTGVAAAIAALSVVGVFAQTDDAEKQAAYNKFTACYKTQVITEIDPCIAVGKEYLTKYGTPPDAFSQFVQKKVDQLPGIKEDLITQAALDKFTTNFKAKNYKDALDGGKTYLNRKPQEPLSMDIVLILATTAYDQTFVGNNPSFKDDGLSLAKLAIQKIEGGLVPEPKACGTPPVTAPAWGGCGNLGYKNKDNALAWMNFTIARLIADTTKDPAALKDAAPYFYKSLQYNSLDLPKSDAYAGIGRYYLTEFNKTVDTYEPCKAQTDYTDECKAIRGKQLAFAERGADAYAHAFKAANDDPKAVKAYKDGLLKKATDFYNIRFNKTDGAGVNDFVAKANASALVNPMTDVTPVLDDPAAVVTPPATPGTTPATNGTKPPVKPVTPGTTTTKPTTTPAKPAGSGKGTVAKTTVKKKNGK